SCLLLHPYCFILPTLLASPILFSFNHTATTEIYTLSLHDALPIFIAEMEDGSQSLEEALASFEAGIKLIKQCNKQIDKVEKKIRSEEHTSELQSRFDLVCRLLLEKKKKKQYNGDTICRRQSEMN